LYLTLNFFNSVKAPKLASLSSLTLANNHIVSIPDTITRCTRLTQFDISHNSLTSLPDNLGALTELKKLSVEFIKYYTSHLKSGHKLVYEEKMGKIICPLKNLIEINFEYRMFNLKYKEK
jgi:hypothetical protein